MTTIDNSKIFLSGFYADAEVTVPAGTTYAAGTVLGRNADGALTAFSTKNNTEEFTSKPLYILAQTLVNDSDSDEVVQLARVFDGGAVDKSKLIFVNEADAEDVDVLDALKVNQFRLEVVQELTDPSSDE